MNAKHTLMNVLTKFAKHVEPASQDATEGDYSQITISGKMTIQIHFNEEKGIVNLIVPIAPNNPEIYPEVLELNMYWEKLAGARFVLLRESNHIGLLQHHNITDMSLQEFEIAFEEFIDIAQSWLDKLGKSSASAVNDTSTIPALIYNDIFNRA